jgi:peptide deformylase
VQAYNLQGEAVEKTVTDLESRAWQHEIDHLDGVLFIDKIGTIGRLASRRALSEFEEDYLKAQERGDIPPDDELKKLLDELEGAA